MVRTDDFLAMLQDVMDKGGQAGNTIHTSLWLSVDVAGTGMHFRECCPIRLTKVPTLKAGKAISIVRKE